MQADSITICTCFEALPGASLSTLGLGRRVFRQKLTTVRSCLESEKAPGPEPQITVVVVVAAVDVAAVEPVSDLIHLEKTCYWNKKQE